MSGSQFANMPPPYRVAVCVSRRSRIAARRRDLEHAQARRRGDAGWHSHYVLRLRRVERAYGEPHQ